MNTNPSRLLALFLALALLLMGTPALAAEGDPDPQADPDPISAPLDPEQDAAPAPEGDPAPEGEPISVDGPVPEGDPVNPPAPVEEPAPVDPDPIAVQLNGALLTFTDAVPELLEGRTFLPFRAVFEAMGAEVGAEGNVISATRGGTTVTMTIGSTDAVVSTDGVDIPLAMDVAPYTKVVDEETGGERSFVPVRFAAQALGCAVGWDADDRTVIVVDTAALMAEVMAGHTYTYLEKYAAWQQQLMDSGWSVAADYSGNMSMMGTPAIPYKGNIEGLTAPGNTKMEYSMLMTMDLLPMLTALAESTQSPVPEETLASAALLSSEGVGLEFMGDLEAGSFYFCMSGPFLESAGLPSGTWIHMDLNAMLEGSGLDFQSLMSASSNIDLAALAPSVAQSAPLADRDSSYQTLRATLEQLAAGLADSGFAANGNVHTATLELVMAEEVSMTMTLALTMQGDQVAGYAMSMVLSGDLMADTPLEMSMVTGIDAELKMTAAVAMDLASMILVDMTLTGAYTLPEGGAILIVETVPPPGAPVIEWTELFGAAMAPPTGD